MELDSHLSILLCSSVTICDSLRWPEHLSESSHSTH